MRIGLSLCVLCGTATPHVNLINKSWEICRSTDNLFAAIRTSEIYFESDGRVFNQVFYGYTLRTLTQVDTSRMQHRQINYFLRIAILKLMKPYFLIKSFTRTAYLLILLGPTQSPCYFNCPEIVIGVMYSVVLSLTDDYKLVFFSYCLFS